MKAAPRAPHPDSWDFLQASSHQARLWAPLSDRGGTRDGGHRTSRTNSGQRQMDRCFQILLLPPTHTEFHSCQMVYLCLDVHPSAPGPLRGGCFCLQGPLLSRTFSSILETASVSCLEAFSELLCQHPHVPTCGLRKHLSHPPWLLPGAGAGLVTVPLQGSEQH